MAEELNKQNIILENRKRLTLSGVNDVENFDDSSITLITELGTLMVKGTDIRIEKLNLDTHEIIANGDFYLFEYISDENSKKGLFSKMFR